MFAFKKIVSTFLFPVALLGGLLGIAVYLLWKDGPMGRRWGRRTVTGALVLFWILGSDWCGDAVLRPLLGKYPSVDVPALRASQGADWSPDYLVVLGAGHYALPDVPPALRLSDRSLARLNLAFHLHREFPRSPIICTAGRLYENFVPLSRDMEAVLQAWGVSPELLITEEQARDTRDHVRYLESTLKGKTFLLITSASHMPRSMALFRHAGLEPVAAPEPDIELRGRPWKDVWRGLIPSGGNFARVETAAYEYMGLLWSKILGQI